MSEYLKANLKLLSSINLHNGDVDKITAPPTLQNEEECQLELLRFEVRQKEEELKSRQQDREQRKDFAMMIYRLLVGYLVVVALILFLVAIDCVYVNLSDSVLITILGTTTANILAIFRFVARYLFK